MSSPREREIRDRRESRGDEREGQGRKRNRNLQMAITYEIFFRIYKKINQVIYSSLPINSPTFKSLALIVFEIFC